MRAAPAWLLALVALAACSQARPRIEPFDPFARAGVDRLADAAAPMDAAFTDASGRPVTLGGIAEDQPIVLVPVQHRCPNLCGVTLAGLARAVATQPYRPGRDFQLVAFGIDPRETPADAQRSRSQLSEGLGGADFGLHALVGSEGAVQATTRGLGYRYAWDPALRQYAHIAAVAVLTPQGKLSRWLYGIQPQPNDLKLALTEAGQGRIGGWGQQLLLLCYHYDPKTGRYGSIIWLALRVGALATMLALAAFVGASILSERRRRGREAPP